MYKVAERFKALQGEGVYTGTPMAFIRFVGCSVGKVICHHCDTDFDSIYNWRGGGTFSIGELDSYIYPHHHVCLTGGEPFDQDLSPFLDLGPKIHVETSGTVPYTHDWRPFWITVSPKPGYHDKWIKRADEVKVIVDGLGRGDGWPTLEDALQWALEGKIVYLQPRNHKNEVDRVTLARAIDLVETHPLLRLSVQLHKLLTWR